MPLVPLVTMLALCMTMLAGVGCQSTHAVAVREDGAPQYEQVKVVYEVSQTRLDIESESDVKLAYIKSHPFKAAIASHQESQQRSSPDQPVSRLTIVYPHPTGDAELAQAVLEIPGEDASLQQVSVTNLQRRELDLLLVNLANGGAFDTEQRPFGNTQMAVEIDGHGISRRWTSEPRLDRLAAQTYDAR